MFDLEKENQKAARRARQADIRGKFTADVLPAALATVSSILGHCADEAAAERTIAELRRNQPHFFKPKARRYGVSL